MFHKANLPVSLFPPLSTELYERILAEVVCVFVAIQRSFLWMESSVSHVRSNEGYHYKPHQGKSDHD